MKPSHLFSIAFILIFTNSIAQVSINQDGTSPDNSAMLDIKSATRGMLAPRMTHVQITSISNPANGLVVFCTTDNQFHVFLANTNAWEGILLGPESALNNESFYFADSLKIIIPDSIPVAVGVECNLYKDNISDLIPDKSNYFISTMTSPGEIKACDMQRQFRYTPVSPGDAVYTHTLRAAGNVIRSKDYLFRSVSKTSGSGTKNVLFIGDSFMAYKEIQAEVLKKYVSDGGGQIKLIGHIGIADTVYEARGGWGILSYSGNSKNRYYINVANFTPAIDMINQYLVIGTTYYRIDKYNLDDSGAGTIELTLDSGAPNVSSNSQFIYTGNSTSYNYTFGLTDDTGNPFWNTATDSLDFSNYMAVYNSGQNLDAVVIQLGFNDLIESTDTSNVRTAINNLKVIIAAIHDDFPGCKIILSMQPFGAYEEGFSSELPDCNFFNHRQTMYYFYHQLLNLWNGYTKIAATVLWVDRLYGYAPTSQYVNSRSNLMEVIPATGIHPSYSGQMQQADCFYSMLRGVL